MKIIEILPAERFSDHWQAWESEGVAPAFSQKQHAIDYAVNNRFGGGTGEVRAYDATGQNVVDVINVDGGTISQPNRGRQ